MPNIKHSKCDYPKCGVKMQRCTEIINV